MCSRDENESNGFAGAYDAGMKTWMVSIKPEDAGGTDLSPDGRVMEMLGEDTLEGWLEGDLLTGRHGLPNSYEAFVDILDSTHN
jgi:xylulose-5-phosphate/fructose-6-phosphate phosphoketolase